MPYKYNPISGEMDFYESSTGATDVTSTAVIANDSVVRGDGGVRGVQDSLVFITDAGIMSGATQLNVDNLRLDGNTISSTDANGNINLTPNGAGVIAGTQLTLTTALDETYGGTGQTTYAQGDVLYASAANTLSKLTAGSDGEVLTLASGVPSWAPASGGYDVSNFSGGMGYSFDDFLSTGATDQYNLMWSSSELNAATISATQVSGHIGVARLRRAGTATGQCSLRLDARMIPPLATKCGFYIQIPTLPDVTDRFDTEVGISDITSASGTVTDGVYFRYVDDENGGNWQIIAVHDGTPNVKDSGIPGSTNWTYLEIECDATWSNVHFYINGVETSNSPLTTNIPTSADTINHYIRNSGTDGSNNRDVLIDRFYLLYP